MTRIPLRLAGPLWASALSLVIAAPLIAAGPGTPPRPKGSATEAVTAAEARALSDWALAQPQIAARLKGHRTRLLKAGLSESGKDGKAPTRAVLSYRDYDAGNVQQVIVDLETGAAEIGEVARLVQPSAEEIAEGMAIVIRDPGLSSFVGDPSLTLMGGFHVKSPYADDPCSREVCLEFAFMKPGPAVSASAGRIPPRRVIVNLSRGAVVNRDYRTGGASDTPSRMTAEGVDR
jgi:hypothetical protein